MTAAGNRDIWQVVDSADRLGLGGAHQRRNAALAVGMIRHQARLDVPDAALRAGLARATWPARLQRLVAGPLRDLLPDEAELWLDGAHNPAAGQAVADFFAAEKRPLHLIVGLLANKDAGGVLRPFRGRTASIQAVPVAGHDHHSPEALNAKPATDIADALRAVPPDGPPVVLIIGSLYLAGEVLKANGQEPS